MIKWLIKRLDERTKKAIVLWAIKLIANHNNDKLNDKFVTDILRIIIKSKNNAVTAFHVKR